MPKRRGRPTLVVRLHKEMVEKHRQYQRRYADKAKETKASCVSQEVN